MKTQYQYFIFKLKDQYLPNVVKECKELKKYSWTEMYAMDKKHFRKLKIQNIEQLTSEDERTLLEFLINTDYTVILTQLEFEKNSGNYNTSSTSGSTGWAGISGTMGAVGVSGSAGITGKIPYQSTTTSWNLPVVTI